EVRIRREGEQARVLVLPAEAGAAREPSGLAHGDLDELAADLAQGEDRLGCGDGRQGVAVDGLDETVAEGVGGGAQRTDLVALDDPLLEGGVDGAVVDEGAARMVDKVGAVEVSGSEFRDLADGAADRALVALATGARVVDGAEALVDLFSLVEVCF